MLTTGLLLAVWLGARNELLGISFTVAGEISLGALLVALFWEVVHLGGGARQKVRTS